MFRGLDDFVVVVDSVIADMENEDYAEALERLRELRESLEEIIQEEYDA